METERAKLTVFCDRCSGAFSFFAGGKTPSICPTCIAGLPGYGKRQLLLARAA